MLNLMNRGKAVECKIPKGSDVSPLNNQLKQMSLGNKGVKAQAAQRNSKESFSLETTTSGVVSDNSNGSKKGRKLPYKKRVKQMLAEEAKNEKVKRDKANEKKQRKEKGTGGNKKPLADLPDPKELSHSGAEEKPLDTDAAAASFGQSRQGDGGGGGAISQPSSSLKCSGCGGELKSQKVAGDKVTMSRLRQVTKVAGTVTTAMQKQWHPECLRCALCNAQLQVGRTREEGEK
ncbi:hypothetical protein GUITHDRAFT_120319 [Guillardia theta CCMP2712]|uniref:LIM zinc-binding domain-containing protein n=1 Tax=Guillardia theta (strain CCMP2712) TaxID=905079 RepID=L1IBQ2_GUITC|nr:hypothetical protein GUITHDRAFT_120319 [Guillardia theta CCMP2712]EKX33517.1 hypothetical protein GUITHDRAFT_120319 [Guillardia theta CCMP2712]|eukprot:XP_005820497.1 hypothetical protein GUITHDRAFT_120319 [Guillardia theta CCMP2712]